MKIRILICAVLLLTGCADSMICGEPRNFLTNEFDQKGEMESQSTEK